MPKPVAVPIELSDGEREPWARRRSSAQALAQRSRIVLGAAEGLKNTPIAGRLGVSRDMAATWRSRLAEQRLMDWSMSRARAGPGRSPTPRSSW